MFGWFHGRPLPSVPVTGFSERGFEGAKYLAQSMPFGRSSPVNFGTFVHLMERLDDEVQAFLDSLIGGDVFDGRHVC